MRAVPERNNRFLSKKTQTYFYASTLQFTFDVGIDFYVLVLISFLAAYAPNKNISCLL